MTRSTSRPRGTARRAVMALVVAAVAALAVAAPAPGQTGPGTPGGSTAGDAGLRLAGQSSWVGPEGTFDLRLLADAPGGALQVRVHPAVTGRIRFDESTRGENLGSPLRPLLPDLPLDALPRDTVGAATLSFPVTAGTAGFLGIRLIESGVYPVSVAVVGADGATLDTLVTHLVRLPGPDEATVPLAVSTVVPVRAPIAHAPTGETVLPETERDRLTRLVGAVAAHPAVPLSLETTPETLDALASAAAPEGAAAVAALGGALVGRQVMARPYVDLDWGSWVAIGDPDELAGQLRAGADTVDVYLGTRPDLASWVADPTVTPDALTWLRESGVQHVAVPDDQVGVLDDGSADPLTQTFAVEDGSGTEIPAVALDGDLGERLVQTDDPVLNAHLALAELAVLHGYAPNAARGVAVRLPDDDLAPATVDAFLGGLEQRTAAPTGAPVVSPVTLDDLFTVTDPATSGRDRVVVREYSSDEPGSLGSLPVRQPPVRERLDGYRSMLGTSLEPAIPFERSLLIAGADGLDDLQRQAYLAGVVQGIDGQLAGLALPDQQRVTLTSESGNIPLSLENTLDYPVTVFVRLRSDKLGFPDGDELTVVLPPGPTRLEVAVEAKASGAFPLELEVRSPDQTLLVGRTDLTVRSTAFSGLGLLLSVAAGGFLAVWWARHFRKVRRNRLLVASGHPSTLPPPADGPPVPPSGPPAGPAPERPSATLAATADPVRPEGEHARSPHRH